MDLGTRGKTLKELEGNEMCWKRPSWISTSDWPSRPQILPSDESKEEEAKSVLHVQSACEDETGLSEIIHLKRYSSKHRLLRVTAWVFTFLECCGRYRKGSRLLDAKEIVNAEATWIKEVQRNLTKDKNFVQLQSGLNVQDVNGILGCEGRLERSKLPFNDRKPCLLPRGNAFTKLVIEECHNLTIHEGVNIWDIRALDVHNITSII